MQSMEQERKREKVDVIIPVYRPDGKLFRLLDRLAEQSVLPDRVYLMNTETGKPEDSCKEMEKRIRMFFAKKRSYPVQRLQIELIPVKKEEFDHGGTRHRAAELSHNPYLLFMTQDAVPVDRTLIAELLGTLRKGADVAYARQMTRPGANVVEAYTRLFNYPSHSEFRTKEAIKTKGIRAFFCSDVCAMYRRECYESLGGFVRKTVFNEDMIFAHGLLMSGGTLAYCAEAKVYHSHNYTWGQQFHRNFDLGVSQADHPQVFSGVSSEAEGFRYVRGLLGYLLNQRYYLEAVDFLAESVFKYAGYFLGRQYRLLPKSLVLRCTTNPRYFQ